MVEVSIWPYEQMVHAQRPGKLEAQTSLGFWDTNASLNLGQTTRPRDSQQKKRIYRIVDFVVPADHKVKLQKGEKRDKYMNLVRELKKQYNI